MTASASTFSIGGWGPCSTFLIYNESDLIRLPAEQHDWGDAAGGLARECAGHVTPYKGHYYWCSV